MFLHMLIKLLRVCERFLTLRTYVRTRLNVLVPQVPCASDRRGKLLLAQFTRVRPLARVFFVVFIETGFIREHLLTDRALVRFFPGVRTHVFGATRRLPERLLADLALVRFFARVHPEMRDERHGLGEALLTQVARVGFLARVDPQMAVQRLRLHEAFLADVTRVRAFAGVRAHVYGEAGRLREAFLAHAALVGLLPRVYSHVAGQVGRLRERLLAHVALVRTLARVHDAVSRQVWIPFAAKPEHMRVLRPVWTRSDGARFTRRRIMVHTVRYSSVHFLHVKSKQKIFAVCLKFYQGLLLVKGKSSKADAQACLTLCCWRRPMS